MSVALIVSLIGLAGLKVLAIKRQRIQTGDEIVEARTNARSAVELA